MVDLGCNRLSKDKMLHKDSLSLAGFNFIENVSGCGKVSLFMTRIESFSFFFLYDGIGMIAPDERHCIQLY